MLRVISTIAKEDSGGKYFQLLLNAAFIKWIKWIKLEIKYFVDHHRIVFQPGARFFLVGCGNDNHAFVGISRAEHDLFFGA